LKQEKPDKKSKAFFVSAFFVIVSIFVLVFVNGLFKVCFRFVGPFF